MTLSLNLILDRITSIPTQEIIKHPELIKLRENLFALKISENYKGYGGKQKIEIEDKTWEKISNLFFKSDQISINNSNQINKK